MTPTEDQIRDFNTVLSKMESVGAEMSDSGDFAFGPVPAGGMGVAPGCYIRKDGELEQFIPWEEWERSALPPGAEADELENGPLLDWLAVSEAVFKMRMDRERTQQILKFGDQTGVPSFPTLDPGADAAQDRASREYLANAYRKRCQDAFDAGRGTYGHVLLEEVFEALECNRPEERGALKTELVQIATVCMAWYAKLCYQEEQDQAAGTS